MKYIQFQCRHQIAEICRTAVIVATILMSLSPLSTVAEKTNVFFGFKENVLGLKIWSANEANAVIDVSVFATNTVFNPYPISITNSVATRLETDSHLTQGIPSLSPPTGRTKFRDDVMISIDMNNHLYMANTWPRPIDGKLGGRFLHSDIKNVAYFFCTPCF